MIKIEILPFNPKFIEMFNQEKNSFQSLIGHEVEIEHIGSTAVPDLMSKPTIDILIGINEFNDRSFFISEITSLGYHYIPEYEIHLPERKYFEKVQDGRHIAHIHLVKKGSEFWRKHNFFRNILKTNQKIRSEYNLLKLELAKKVWKNRNDYAAAKIDFIKRVEDNYFL